MAEVNAVDAGEVRERVAAAEVEDDDALRFSVFLVIGKGGFHQELFADEPGGGVTAFADVARRTKILYGRFDGGRIAIDADFNQLLSAVHLGFKIGLCARADVAGDAIDVRVRGDFVGGVLGMHDMAGLTAKLRRIHVGCATITGNGNHEKVDDGGDENDVEAVAEDAVVEINPGKRNGNLS